MNRLRSAALAALLLLLLGLPATAAEDFGPWEAPKASSDRRTPDGLEPLAWGVRLFQRFISPVDGPRCPMYPTCSAYAIKALKKHGPFIGAMMTVDRLYHESDPREHRHPVERFDRIRYLDPLENNDFWFAKDPGSAIVSKRPQ